MTSTPTPETTPAPTTTAESSLRHTPFYDYHAQQGGKMVPFAGWEMPLHYGSIIEEHHQVRNSGGLFDVSHMGRFRITGKDARRFLDRICTRQIWGMADSSARYSFICNDRGGCKDDVLVYRIKEGEYLMVCNAANREKLLSHFDDVRSDLIFKLKDETEDTAMVAIQGPKVIDMISRFSSEVPALKRFRFTIKNLLIVKVMISRTGYTGEDGIEVILPAKFARSAIDMMRKSLGEDGAAILKPVGLAARDSLRLEAAMALYGHELTEDRNVLETGLGFAMKLNKADGSEKSPTEVGRFIGQDALDEIAKEGPKQVLAGLELEGKRAARQDMIVKDAGGNEVGVVTSGCWSHTLEKSIALAYVDVAMKEPGTNLQVDLGRTTVSARVCGLPFYKM